MVARSTNSFIDAHLGADRPVGGKYTSQLPGGNTLAQDAWSVAHREGGERGDITAPGSPEAGAWSGWGSALKPAAEHWILARKPLIGTYAENVLTHGTGGLNIEGCRVGDEVRYNPPAANKAGGASFNMSLVGMPQDATGRNAVGRWPAHLVLDEAAAAALDASVPPSKSRKGKPRGAATWEGWGMTATGAEHEDSGGPSRFFFVAKAPRKEKEAGLDHLPVRAGGDIVGREEGSAGMNSPRAGAGRSGAMNHHPTVKNIALMRWLCRLITPPGGTILDPFAGSGSTGVAALAEGFNFVGCEMTEEYLPIIEGRLRHALKGTS